MKSDFLEYSGPVVRLADETEFRQLARIETKSYKQKVPEKEYQVTVVQVLDEWKRFSNDDRLKNYVCEVDVKFESGNILSPVTKNNMLGVISIQPDPSIYMINHLYTVKSDYQSGKLLLKKAVEEAYDINAPEIFLCALNAKSYAWYRRLGFEGCGENALELPGRKYNKFFKNLKNNFNI